MSPYQTGMIYIPGCNRLEEGDRLSSFFEELRRVQTEKNISLLIEITHQQEEEVSRYQIQQGQIHLIQTLQEDSPGDEKSLGNFLKWSQEYSAADPYILIIWNHGNPWNIQEFKSKPLYRTPFPYEAVARAIFLSTVRTILTQQELMETVYADQSASLRDFLDILELKKALQGSRIQLGILGLDGCPANLLEELHEIKEAVRFVIGPGDGEWKKSWIQSERLRVPMEQPNLSLEDSAGTWVKQLNESQGKSLSLLNLTHLDLVTQSLDRLALTLKTHLSQMYGFFSQVRREAQVFSNPNYVDLYDLATLLKKVENRDDLKEETERLLSSLNTLVFEDPKTKDTSDTRRVGIFFPENRRILTPYYQKLDFAETCSNWIEFINAYLEFVPTQEVKRARI
jgi:hypothetical protein